MQGYALNAEGAPVTLNRVARAIPALSEEKGIAWVDLEGDCEKDLRTLGEALDISEDAIDDCLTGEQRPRIDEFEDYVLIVVYGAVGPEAFAHFEPRKLSILYSPRFVITVHAEPLRTTTKLLERCSKRPKTFLRRGTDQLLFSILDSLVDNYRVVSQFYADQLESLEERSLERVMDDALLGDLSTLRKELLELRRITIAQRELVIPIAAGELDYISDGLERDFMHVRDHLTTVVETIDSSRELLHGIRDNYHAAVANRANEIMKVLTIFASLFLPLSLLAGVYGMNTPLWPDPSKMGTFVGIVVVMVVAVSGMLVVFKIRKWF